MKKSFGYLFLLAIIFFTSCNNKRSTVKDVSSDSTTIKEHKITNDSGDLDENKVAKNNIKEKTKLKTCTDIVMEILTTSPAYLKRTKGLYEAIVKNGGISFGITIEASPNPKRDNAMDFSNTYDFSLHETYSDRMPVIARFTFNPIERQLYEYDFAEDKLNPIDFDRNLLLKFNEICK